MDRRRLILPLLLLAGVAAFLVGAAAIRDMLAGPKVETVATTTLEAMRAQNRLVPFVARFVSVSSSRTERFGVLSAERTLILPGTVRYEIDLAKLQPGDVRWDESTSTLRVLLPEIELAGPEVDLEQAREYGGGGVLGALTDARKRLDRANRTRAVADLRAQARAAVPMGLAREAGRDAIERSFALPLHAAGFKDARVIARYPTEGSRVTEPLDHSRSYNEVLDEAARTR